jgi:hypothetical protein
MMIHVAVIGIALQAIILLRLYSDMARKHWATCKEHAARYTTIASAFRQFLPETTADKAARYYETLAEIYENAKWRPWEDFPAVQESRYYEDLVELCERANLPPQAVIPAQPLPFP